MEKFARVNQLTGKDEKTEKRVKIEREMAVSKKVEVKVGLLGTVMTNRTRLTW